MGLLRLPKQQLPGHQPTIGTIRLRIFICRIINTAAAIIVIVVVVVVVQVNINSLKAALSVVIGGDFVSVLHLKHRQIYMSTVDIG